MHAQPHWSDVNKVRGSLVSGWRAAGHYCWWACMKVKLFLCEEDDYIASKQLLLWWTTMILVSMLKHVSLLVLSARTHCIFCQSVSGFFALCPNGSTDFSQMSSVISLVTLYWVGPNTSKFFGYFPNKLKLGFQFITLLSYFTAFDGGWVLLCATAVLLSVTRWALVSGALAVCNVNNRLNAVYLLIYMNQVVLQVITQWLQVATADSPSFIVCQMLVVLCSIDYALHIILWPVWAVCRAAYM